ncbi:hypothetical protein CDD80_3607 [Ophiocordyceps camponoti-rufipedis]|uniref:non-specific serine/threonine protein kinase n=1 Tax=Ophiocordyceps camponoti-rufipedis TaxID=2004952 RepID=A0A2C5XIL5_9HYPO|nr:hypothetical protein CDD80_3607 [Ophiocordyceps camponoti-rufipedis]
MSLSDELKDLIGKYPLDELNEIRGQFKKWDSEEVENRKTLFIFDLVTSLGASKLVANLPIGHRVSMRAKIQQLDNEHRRGIVNVALFDPIFDALRNEKDDLYIWDAFCRILSGSGPSSRPPVLDLPPSAAGPGPTSRPSTPPNLQLMPFGSHVHLSTPATFSSAQTRGKVDDDLWTEISTCHYKKVDGFVDTFFDATSWEDGNKTILNNVLSGAYSNGRWVDFPERRKVTEDTVRDWIKNLLHRYMEKAPNKLFHTTKTSGITEKINTGVQIDIMFRKSTPSSAPGGSQSLKDILVVGELKRSDRAVIKSLLTQLARYARAVFAEQPLRRFVHGFCLTHDMMEMWVFDRSGCYSSGKFSVHKDPEWFARAIVGYATMSWRQLGMDVFTRHNGGRWIGIPGHGDRPETRYNLVDLLCKQAAIVCRGTACYSTDSGHVIKFSWVSGERAKETLFLKKAADCSVKGVVRVVDACDIVKIEDIRSGLRFPSSASEPASKKQKLDRPGPSEAGLTSGYNDRVFRCIVLSPAGRPLGQFTSLRELLGSLRDAIEAHRSLFMDAGILHRDISVDNVIITDPQVAEGMRGILIDLDLAKEVGSDVTGARHRTGASHFMSIEALRQSDAALTYRHDLEGFLYILLWCAAYVSWDKAFVVTNKKAAKKAQDRLGKWLGGDFQEVARVKAGDMGSKDGIGLILELFPSEMQPVKGLCMAMWRALFPWDPVAEGPRLGAPLEEPLVLYQEILGAFDAALMELPGDS